MSLSTGQTKLTNAMKELMARWDGTRHNWSDEVSSKFEEKYLVPLRAVTRTASEAMGQMAVLVTKARRDCE